MALRITVFIFNLLTLVYYYRMMDYYIEVLADDYPIDRRLIKFTIMLIMIIIIASNVSENSIVVVCISL